MHVAEPGTPPADVFMYTYSIDLLQRGIVVFAGRTIDRSAASFATVVIYAKSADDARAIMQNDPAVEGGLFRARLFPYQPMLMGSWPS